MRGIGKIAEADDLPLCLRSRDLEPLEGFGSSFSGTRLDTAWALTHALLGDECEEQCKAVCFGMAQRASGELVVELHGVLEAQCARLGRVITGS